MAKTAMIRARTNPGLKTDVEKILKKLGLTTTEAINIFFSLVKLRKGLPFEVKVPNKVSAETFRKTDAGSGLKEYEGMEEFKKKMSAKC